jgi:hypothetical protein
VRSRTDSVAVSALAAGAASSLYCDSTEPDRPATIDAAEGQIKGCVLAGGEAQVETVRTNGLGPKITAVTCKGGLLDGVTCMNTYLDTICAHSDVPSEAPADGSSPPISEVVPTWTIYEVVTSWRPGRTPRSMNFWPTSKPRKTVASRRHRLKRTDQPLPPACPVSTSRTGIRAQVTVRTRKARRERRAKRAARAASGNAERRETRAGVVRRPALSQSLFRPRERMVSTSRLSRS